MAASLPQSVQIGLVACQFRVRPYVAACASIQRRVVPTGWNMSVPEHTDQLALNRFLVPVPTRLPSNVGCLKRLTRSAGPGLIRLAPAAAFVDSECHGAEVGRMIGERGRLTLALRGLGFRVWDSKGNCVSLDCCQR
jgi:hypothetical protein